MKSNKPMWTEVGLPLILDCGLHNLPEGFGSCVNLTEFPIEGVFATPLVLKVLMVFWSGFDLIPSFHSGMSLTSFGTHSGYGHKYMRCIGIRGFIDFLNSYEFLHPLP